MPAPTSHGSPVWPVLVADLAYPGARDFLTGIALAEGAVYLPLMNAPGTVATYVLEIYSPDTIEPLRLFAEPLGAPNDAGFPLRLRIYDPPEASEPVASPGLRARAPTGVTLTERDSCDPDAELNEVRPEGIVGRAIARGKFIIEAIIGAGGVGSVYRATHRDLQIPVAVKVLHANFQRDLDFCRRFHSEGLAASRLDHPNLMRVLDFGQEPDGLLYLAMEHLDGKCLAGLLEVGTPLPLSRIVDIMMQICAGLAHAHARGIVHRDIKPDNIVLIANLDDDERPDELVKVCDFGIAVEPNDGTASGTVVGTPDYMSPEQCRGEQLDGRSDVYSCGIMMYELAVGRMPFEAPTTAGLLNRHMHSVPPPPSTLVRDLDPRLEAIIMKALAKEPEDRQQSMRALRLELAALLGKVRATLLPLSEEKAPRVEPPTGPEWLEQGGSYRHDSYGDVALVNVNGRLLAGELVARHGPWLSAFAETERSDQFESQAARLMGALPVLMGEGQMRVLFAVRCTLDELASQDGSQPTWRIAAAQRLQLSFGEPTFLASLAEAALSVDQPAREITELIVRLGMGVTYALYSARLKLHDRARVSRRFVLLVRELGAEALPMVRAGLARLEPKRDWVVATALATDLFQASPRVSDDEAGDLASRYLHGSTPELTSAAAEALVGFWGSRATPFLLGLLGSHDDRVVLTAIEGLRELQMVDQNAVTKIALAVRSTTSLAVRKAAHAAFAEMSGGARVIAQQAMAQLGSESPFAPFGDGSPTLGCKLTV